ncbi:hypothetical protein [Domibacillus indicus]|nr:hypothetical protein [Domibacillus indicus]
MRFVDELADFLYDIFAFILRPVSYFAAGMILVSLPLYLIVWIFGFFH